jgi:hypothetical protein
MGSVKLEGVRNWIIISENIKNNEVCATWRGVGRMVAGDSGGDKKIESSGDTL